MPLLKFENLEGGNYFVTTNTNNRVNLFGYNNELAQILDNIFNFYQTQNKYLDDLHIRTIMPNHYHYLCKIKPNIKPDQFSKFFKRYVSRQILKYLSEHKNAKFKISFKQIIVDQNSYKLIVKNTGLNYREYAPKKKDNRFLYDWHKWAYLIDLNLVVSESGLIYPKIIGQKNMQDKIVNIVSGKNYREIFLLLAGEELINFFDRKFFQDSSFIRKITDSDIFNQKANYIYENAWRKGLCKRPEDWLWLKGSLIKNGELVFNF